MMARQPKKQTIVRLKSTADGIELRSDERQLLHQNQSIPERQTFHLPPLFPPVPRGTGSNRKSKQRCHQGSDGTLSRLPPFSNTAMCAMAYKTYTESSDWPNKQCLKSHNENKNRHKTKEIKQNPDTYETCDKSRFEEHNEVHTKGERGFKNIVCNNTVIQKKPTRLEPLNIQVKSKMAQHKLVDDSTLVPHIKHVSETKAELEWNRNTVHTISRADNVKVAIEYDNRVRATHVKDNSEGYRQHLCEDDEELRNELRLDLSFLYRKKKVKKSSKAKKY